MLDFGPKRGILRCGSSSDGRASVFQTECRGFDARLSLGAEAAVRPNIRGAGAGMYSQTDVSTALSS